MQATLYVLAAFLGLMGVIGFVVMLNEAWRAPEGYQDAKGFHAEAEACEREVTAEMLKS